MPVPWLAIASTALPLLQKLGESRDVGRYKRQLEQQQKTANLINALSKGRVEYQPTAEYQPSAFTQITGAASTGLGAYNAFQNLQAAQAAEKLAQEKGALEVTKLRQEGATRRGMADYLGRERPQIGEWAPQPQEQWGQPPPPKIGDWAGITPPAPAPPAVGAPGPRLRGGFDMGVQPTGGLDIGPPPAFGPPPRLLSQLGDLGAFERMGMEQAKQAEARQRQEDVLKGRKQLVDEQKLGLALLKFQDELNKLTDPQLDPKAAAAIEKGLRGEYIKLTQEFKSIGESFETIMAGADDPTGASDLSLIFNFMKMLDPTSVVRESEFAAAERSGSFSEAVQNYINRFWDGERLTVTRPQFLKQALEIYKVRIPGYENIGSQYAAIAGRGNVDPLNVVLDFTINTNRAQQLIKDLPGKADPRSTSGAVPPLPGQIDWGAFNRNLQLHNPYIRHTPQGRPK